MKNRIILVLFFLSSVSSASESDMSLADILNLKIEVSSSTPLNIFSTPSIVSVVDESTIREYNFTSAKEALRFLSGVDVTRTFLSRNLPTIRGLLQDHFNNKILILINGVPSWNSVTGGGILERIHPKDLSRIEVLKGPASVLYGSNAYVGAINFVLKSESGSNSFHTDIEPERNGISMGGHLTGKTSMLSYYVSGSGRKSSRTPYDESSDVTEDLKDGIFQDEGAYQGETDVNTAYIDEFEDSNNFTLQLESQHELFKADILYNAYSNGTSYLGTPPINNKGTGLAAEQKGYIVGLTPAATLLENLVVSLPVSHDVNIREYPTARGPNQKARIHGERLSTGLKIDWNLKKYITFELGYGSENRQSVQYEIVDPRDGTQIQANNMVGRQVKETSIYGQVGFYGNQMEEKLPFSVLLGVRSTENEKFDSNTSFRSTLVVFLSELSSFKLMYGQSYRSPSLFELFFEDPQSTNEIYGNEEVKPETSNSIELAYLQSFAEFHFVQLLFYQGVYKDKIARTRRSPGSITDLSEEFTNGDEFSSSGIELEYRYLNQKIGTFNLNYSYIEGDDGDKVDDRYNFRFVPKQTLSAGLSKKFGNLSTSLLYSMIGAVEGNPKLDENGSRIGGSHEIDTQHVGDVNIGYVHKKVLHTISVKNIGDANIEVPEYIRGIKPNLTYNERRSIVYSIEFSL
ncbi:TonB-dependent receptor plug domain-containing protein [Pseudobacteriovorax antillogorgiicola]|uniref:Outer membrane receptor proteins, mostly Fe transport n=1 Tax=Pseudobacteriovorax antillogorgiicola TaxID=1513793 RepID=A0A1Y6CXE9_9BACT|nr:TonB-dependent receptor [Pseudobacteriovorax antillogorgiicola]TCS51633.1 outer membrane receptor protein involved in Fe transport [Pseudobacteriovorax antillogorgiicola]SMF81579.1 Outer membrane receptor proteins, mostly Fe transport [Pseudobacteriovorax antillogorgiicola]